MRSLQQSISPVSLPYVADDLEKLKFKDEVTSVQEEVNRLKAAGVNIIIGLSHSGHALDKRVAAEVSGLDVIIGGHTNTFLYTGRCNLSIFSSVKKIFFLTAKVSSWTIIGI